MINVKLTVSYICSNAVMKRAYEFKRTSLLKFNFWIKEDIPKSLYKQYVILLHVIWYIIYVRKKQKVGVM